MRLTIKAALGSAAFLTLVSAAPATEGGRKFSVVLTGANECNTSGQCGIGDATATGTADITINPGQRRVCWEITTTGVHPQNTITGAHIHPGVAGVNGPAFIHVTAVKNGTTSGCTSVSGSGAGTPLTRAQINAILAAPQNYYLNLHWWDTDPAEPQLPDLRAGAIRGQLAKGRLK